MVKGEADMEENRQEELEQELAQRHGIIHREGDFMEIVPKGFNKATGIQEMCKALGIAHEDTYAFGDSTNDLAMFEHVPNAVVMGHHLSLIHI